MGKSDRPEIDEIRAEMERIGLMRGLKVAAQLVPPPNWTNNPTLTANISKFSAMLATVQFLNEHEGFEDFFLPRAVIYTLKDVFTDDMFKPDPEFIKTITESEKKKVYNAKTLAGIANLNSARTIINLIKMLGLNL